MRTFYSLWDTECPTIIVLAHDEDSALNKIAEILMDLGQPDPRSFIDFSVMEIEDGDDPVVIYTPDFYGG